MFCFIEKDEGSLDCLLNTLNAELNPIRHLLALIGARHIVHVSRIRVNMPLRSRIHQQRSPSFYSVFLNKV